MAQNMLWQHNLMNVITQIQSAAAAAYLRNAYAGIETTSVEVKLPNTEELRAAILEVQYLQVDLIEWLREDPNRLSLLFPEAATPLN